MVNLLHARPPSCSTPRDEAVAANHITIEVHTKLQHHQKFYHHCACIILATGDFTGKMLSLLACRYCRRLLGQLGRVDSASQLVNSINCMVSLGLN